MTESTCEFGSLTIAYDDRVLAPRPWTLLQSDWAVDLARTLPQGPILELCAGAGHIGLSAAVRAERALVQVEADEVAAGFARRNAAAVGLASCEVRCGSMLDVLEAGESFPLILADPPYLPTAELTLFPDDPATAIDGGPDGLDVVRMCVAVVRDHLAPGGACLLQVRGDEQARAVAQLVAPAFELVATKSADAERAVVHLVHARL